MQREYEVDFTRVNRHSLFTAKTYVLWQSAFVCVVREVNVTHSELPPRRWMGCALYVFSGVLWLLYFVSGVGGAWFVQQHDSGLFLVEPVLQGLLTDTNGVKVLCSLNPL